MIPVSLFAIPIALAGNAIVMLGYVLQKRASRKFPPIEKTTLKQNVKNFLTSPIWLLGILCTTLSIPAALYAYSFGNIVLVNSLGGTGLVFLAIFSYLLLGERLGRKEYVAYSILILGVIISGIFSSKTSTQENIGEFWALFINFSSLVFLAFLSFLAIVACIVEFNSRLLPNYRGLTSTISAGIFMALGMIAMKGWGMFFKDLTFSSLRDFRFWFFAFFNILFSNLATILMQFTYQRAKAITAVPIYHSTVLMLPIIYGALFLKEWNDLLVFNKLWLSIGLTVITIGMVFLLFNKKTRPLKDEMPKNIG